LLAGTFRLRVLNRLAKVSPRASLGQGLGHARAAPGCSSLRETSFRDVAAFANLVRALFKALTDVSKMPRSRVNVKLEEPMSYQLACEYLDKWCPPPKRGLFGRAKAKPYFAPGDPKMAMELIWVLQPLFAGPDQAPFRDTEYRSEFEGEVDALLLEWAATDPMQIEIPSIAHGRVLEERYRQSLLVIAANQAAGKTVLIPDDEIPLALRQSAIVLLWLHEMDLLWEPGTTTLRR